MARPPSFVTGILRDRRPVARRSAQSQPRLAGGCVSALSVIAKVVSMHTRQIIVGRYLGPFFGPVTIQTGDVAVVPALVLACNSGMEELASRHDPR
jgi:hypothetical protein